MSVVTHMLKNAICNPLARKTVLAAAAMAGLAANAPVAQAGGFRDHHDHDRSRVNVDIRIGDRRPDRCEPRYHERQVRVWVPAVYRTECDKRWIEPVYRTVCDRRFIPAEVRTVCEKVWIPDAYEIREVRHRDRFGRVQVCRERVLVRSGHFESRDRQVVVRQGRWETFDRQECVSPGRWETIERQVCVSEGHYEMRTERVRLADAELAPWQVTAAGLGIRIGR